MRTKHVEGELTNEWQGGKNEWMSKNEIQGLEPKFKDTVETLEELEDPPRYTERTIVYKPGEY